ncbi:MAG: hypothetical protein ABGZ53_09020, partial [Fuerstiella sp.]
MAHAVRPGLLWAGCRSKTRKLTHPAGLFGSWRPTLTDRLFFDMMYMINRIFFVVYPVHPVEASVLLFVVCPWLRA